MPTYCINCRSTKVKQTVEENNVYYLCAHCGEKSGKALVVDGKIKIINTSRGIKHIVAAALIIKDGKILLTQRRTYPFGLETPVGHVEYEESFEEALYREVYEEVGLKVTTSTLLAQIEQPISYCRFGAAIEEWVVFLVEVEGENYVANDEIESVVWVPLTEVNQHPITPNTQVILTQLGYLDRRTVQQRTQ